MTPLVLSCFPGIGLLDLAFELEGFCIVRGPDLLWGGDIRRFHPPAGKFDGVIGGPPCQAHSPLERFAEYHGRPHDDLIPEFVRVVNEAQPAWFLMENVRGAPSPELVRYEPLSIAVLNNRWFGAEQHRERRFVWGAGRINSPWNLLEINGERAARWAPTVCKKNFDRGPDRFACVRGLQGLPETFDLPGFTAAAKLRALFNGVPLPMGRAVARAVRRALNLPLLDEAAA